MLTTYWIGAFATTTVNFGNGLTVNQLSPMYYDGMMGYMDATGIAQWARAFGGSNHDSALDVVFTTTGDMIVVGKFYGKFGQNHCIFILTGGFEIYRYKYSIWKWSNWYIHLTNYWFISF